MLNSHARAATPGQAGQPQCSVLVESRSLGREEVFAPSPTGGCRRRQGRSQRGRPRQAPIRRAAPRPPPRHVRRRVLQWGRGSSPPKELPSRQEQVSNSTRESPIRESGEAIQTEAITLRRPTETHHGGAWRYHAKVGVRAIGNLGHQNRGNSSCPLGQGMGIFREGSIRVCFSQPSYLHTDGNVLPYKARNIEHR